MAPGVPTCWIRQAIGRAIDRQVHEIRLPLEMAQRARRMERVRD